MQSPINVPNLYLIDYQSIFLKCNQSSYLIIALIWCRSLATSDAYSKPATITSEDDFHLEGNQVKNNDTTI